MSIRATCESIRSHLARGRGRAARNAIRAARFPRRVQGARDDLRHVFRLLRLYRKRFPGEGETVKRTLWRAVRAVTPTFVPSPAFECLGVDKVECELVAKRRLLDDYATGRLSVVHRLFHYGYREAADALEVLRDSAPFDATLVPSTMPRGAVAVLRVTGDASGERPRLATLRAAVTLGVVVGDPLYVEHARSFIQNHRPDLIPTLHRLLGSVRDELFDSQHFYSLRLFS